MIVRECHDGVRVSAPSGLMSLERISVEDMYDHVCDHEGSFLPKIW